MMVPESKEARWKTMRSLLQGGLTLQKVGEQFGLTRERVRQITGSPSKLRISKKEAWANQKEQVVFLWEKGYTTGEIARALGIPQCSMHQFRLTKTHPRPKVHGKRSTYNGGCRCKLCKKAGTDAHREYQRDLRARGLCVRCRTPSKTWLCRDCAPLKKNGKGRPVGLSGVRGVSWNTHDNGWRVVRTVNGKQVCLGIFQSLEKAKEFNAQVTGESSALQEQKARAVG